MSDNNNQEQQGLQLELSPEVAQGQYANFAMINHSSSDFIIDFAALLPGLPKAKIGSRIILAPEHAKRLLMALQENISKYESLYGPIHIQSGDPVMPVPFSGMTGEA